MAKGPDYSTPNKKKRFVEAECQMVQKAVEQASQDKECYLDGVYGMRRQKAILKYLERAEKEFRSFGFVSVVESFTKNELMPFNNYNHLDEDVELRIGAALWILDKLRAGGAMLKAYDILPDVSGDPDIWYLPIDFSHPCYANDLIQSVIHVITNRYGTKRGVVITEGNAGRKKPARAYQELLDLLPEEDVKKACDEFKAKLWELSGRFMKGQAYYDREIERIVREIQNMQSGPRSGSFAADSGNGGAKMGMPGLGGLPLDLTGGLPGMVGGMSGRGSAGLPAGNRNIDIVRRGQELMEQSHDYVMHFDRYLWMERKTVRRESGSREVADAVADFMVTDPYELCFALFYLMDTGDDAPWLMRSGSSLMLYVLRMLPWHVEQEDWDDEDWDIWYDGLQYNRDGWLEQGKVEEPIDYYHERHGDRNLAQVIYDLCRTVVPTGLHPFEKDRLRLVAEGMEEDKARKITDTADLLFLYAFQARQRVSGDMFPGLNDEEKEEKTTETAAASALPVTSVSLPMHGGYWGQVMGQNGEADIAESHSDAEGTGEDAAKLKAEANELRKQLKSLKNALAVTRQEANNERARYEHELKALRMEHRELADLRELVFNREQDDREGLEKAEKNYGYPYETKKRTVVFGGHDSFLRAIKPMLPEVKFVDASNMTYSPEIIRNADVVWIQNNCISHPQYWSIVRNCKLAGVQMRYFGFASAEKCAEQLVDWDQRVN